MNTLHDPLGSATGAEIATEETEMAFVPASERQRTTPTTTDTIITVGQRSQQKKKRKRNLASNGPEDDVEVFDYTAEPSLLDTGGTKQVGPMTKKRNKGERMRCCISASILTPSKNQHQRSMEISRHPPKRTINPGAVTSHSHFADTRYILLRSVVV